MKSNNLSPAFTLTAFLALAAAGIRSMPARQGIKITNRGLEIAVNDRMQMQVKSLFDGAGPLMKDYSNSEYLVTKYFTADEFILRSEHTEEIQTPAGKGKEWILTGEYQNYPLEKIVRITTYPQFPNTAYFRVKYVNKGPKELPLIAWVANHYDILPAVKDTPAFWSFQGSSHSDRRDWIQRITPGLHHKNYMGMNASDYGGGIPVLDLWRRDAGIAIGMTDRIARLVSLPVDYDQYRNTAAINVRYDYQDRQVLFPHDTLTTFETFVGVHTGDCFPALRNYAGYMAAKGIKAAPPEPASFEPMWCAWGYGRDFTVKEILHTLPKVKALGIKWVGVDDGYQQNIGDWHTAKNRFPDGDTGMKALVDSIHALGLKAMLWWNPIAVSPQSDFLKKNPDVLLIRKDGGPQYITWWNSFYLSPTDSLVLRATGNTTELFIKEWGFDGLKLDGQNMNMTAPDYGDGHGITRPDQSFELLPQFYREIFATARKMDTGAVVEFCPCGEVMNFYIMPYTNQFVASDPESSWQVRSKALVYHALMPHTAFYGDHVELIGDDFASQIGVGGVPGTKFVWPRTGASREEDLLLSPEKEALFKKWITLYNRLMLSKGEYLGGLYDVGYDSPETHCIEKDGVLYYAFYHKDYNGQVTLKGLDSSRRYRIGDYFHHISYGTVKGKDPRLPVHFRGFLLLEARPEDS